MSVELTSCGEGNDHIASNSKKSSSSYDDEELDYEEEIEDLKGNSNLKNDNDEEGEIIDNDDSIDDRLMSMTKHSVIDKDEGMFNFFFLLVIQIANFYINRRTGR